MHNRPQRTHKVRPQGRAHLCNPPLRSRLRASGGSRPLNPAQTACARLAGVMPPSGLPLPESARVWIAGFAPSPQPPAPRTRAASRRDPIASAVSTSARVRARRSRRFYTVDSVARSPNSRRPVSTRGVDPDRRERRSVARGRAARVWGHGLARACSAHVALSVSLAPHASQTLLQLVLPARTPASHAPGMRR